MFYKLFLLSCLFAIQLFSSPGQKIENGVLDLRQYDFSQNKIINLRGNWKFAYNQLYYDYQNFPKAGKTITVPGKWNHFHYHKKKIGSYGYGTYYLKILLPLDEPISQYSLKITRIGTASNIFVNGKKYFHSGVVARSVTKQIPELKGGIINITNLKNPEIHILIQVANFHHRKGGLWKPIFLGKTEDIIHLKNKNIFIDTFLFGSILIIGIYHFSLYFMKIKNLTTLFFSLFCIATSFRVVFTGETFFENFLFNLGFETRTKIEYLTFYLGTPFFAGFVYHQFGHAFLFKKAFKYLVSLLYIFSFIILFSKVKIFSHTVSIYQLLTLIASIYITAFLFKAIHDKIEGSKMFLAGWLILLSLIINDILYNQGIIISINLAPLGLLVFIIIQSIILARKLSNAFFEIQRLSTELESKNEQLSKIDKLKDEFLANTSHELRTPLNGIIGIAESMIDGAGGDLPTIARENLAMVVASGKRLSALINDILDFSKLKNQELTIQMKPLDIRTLVEIVMKLSTPLIKDKNITIINTIPVGIKSIIGDENRVQQILYNLIGNAIKFTEQGKIQIQARQLDDFIEISIQDSGIGIPAEKINDVFKSFEQVDASTAREYGGTGIGLSITKKLVELHNGKIWLKSELGTGSTFYFTLPCSDEKSIQLQDRELSIPIIEQQKELEIDLTSENIRVLIVDDEPINIQVLKNHLSLKDYLIIQAFNGHDALDIIENYTIPDIVLLDVMMPKMNGYQVCEQIRNKYPADKLPVIMLTAKNRVIDIVEGFNSGANDYLTKPFHKDELLMRIKTHLSLARINTSYARFFPNEFLQHLEQDNILEVKLGDHKQKLMSVLFSDIRSFTSLSESMSSEESFNFINSYLKRIGPKVRKYNGFIDKYIGDAIMALYPNSANDAVDSAIEMLDELYHYNQHRLRNGHPRISIGLGIHTGNLTLGIVGEHGRMEGTVISDAVNLAARLESATKQYQASIIISEDTYRLLKDKEKYDSRKIAKATVMGKSKPVVFVEILNGNSKRIIDLKLSTKQDFETAVEFYTRAEFAEAIQLFKTVLANDPKDLAAEKYLINANRYHNHGVPPDWQGIEILDKK